MKVKYGTIIVRDMDKSIEFYTNVMGLRIDSVYNPQPGIKITLLRGEGEAMVELIQNQRDQPGLYSVGMEVLDVSSTVQSLKSKGAQITMEPVPITGGMLAFVKDPNGVRIALVQHH